LVVGTLALVVFGPHRLPEIARTIGRVISEFKRQANELTSEFKGGLDLGLEDDEDDEDEEPGPADEEEAPVFAYGGGDVDGEDGEEDGGHGENDAAEVGPALTRGTEPAAAPDDLAEPESDSPLTTTAEETPEGDAPAAVAATSTNDGPRSTTPPSPAAAGEGPTNDPAPSSQGEVGGRRA